MFEIGTTLREARMRSGLDIQECERQTKIRAKYLRAMEEEEFDVLPAPAYVRGFLRSYAEHLGLDGRLMIDEYESRFVPREVGLDPDVAGKRDSSGSKRRVTRKAKPKRNGEARLLWSAISSMLVVSVMVYGGFGGTDDGDTGTTALPSATTPTTTATARPGPRPGDRADPLTPPSPATPGPMRIAVTGLDPEGSYLEVHGGGKSGPVAFEGTLAPGESRRWSVQRGLWMLVGQTAGVRLTVNGVERPLRAGTAAYQITRRGIVRQPTE